MNAYSQTELQQEPAPKTLWQVRQLLKDAGSANPQWRAAAEARLEAMGHDAIPCLFAIMRMSARTGRDNARLLWVLFCLLIGVMCVASIAMGLREGSLSVGITSVGIVLAMALATRASMSWLATQGGLTRSELQLLLRVADRRSIPALMELKSRLIDVDQQWLIRVRLTELLPTVRPTDPFPSADRARLVQSIRDAEEWDARSDIQFAIATLQALGQVGGHDALHLVLRLSRSAKEEDIRLAAHHCLPLLQSRLCRQQIGSTLLRPSQFTTSPDELVRAAGVPAQAHEELLRPEIAAPGGINDANVVQCLLQNGATIDATSNTGNTALMEATLAGNLETVRVLLREGADLALKK